MDQINAALTGFFGQINGLVVPYLLAVAGLGTLTMAILQAIKDTTPVCRWYQRFRMLTFLKEHAALVTQKLNVNPDPLAAEWEILTLATDSDKNAFYNLEIEKLCGQWNAATKIAIDYPTLYPNFFACVAARASETDILIVMAHCLPDTMPPHAEANLDPEKQKRRMHQRQSFVDARTRVSNQVQRAVDSFQISATFRWQWLLRTASYILSFLFAVSAMEFKPCMRLTTAVVSAAIAGFLAPVARDLMASIQKLRS
jgi:hypothetical protein